MFLRLNLVLHVQVVICKVLETVVAYWIFYLEIKDKTELVYTAPDNG